VPALAGAAAPARDAVSLPKKKPTGAGRPILLVLRARGLGDFLTAIPAYRALAENFPRHRCILAAPAALTSLARLCRYFDGFLPFDALRALPPRLGRPDIAVNLHGPDPASHRILLETRPRRLLTFAREDGAGSLAGQAWRPREHDVERWCRLLAAYGVRANPYCLDIPAPRILPSTVRGATLLHPGAGAGARRWPAERWVALARHEQAAGRQVIITGTLREQPLTRAIAAGAGLPGSAVHAGRTTLRGLVALVAAAGCVVSGDTGVAHLATALATPSLTLFGPSSPFEWGPPPYRPWHRVLWHGHIGDPDGERPDPGMLEITVPEVIESLAELRSSLPGYAGLRRSA
jgi:ADP-heptose:LPS heptosyltransferase